MKTLSKVTKADAGVYEITGAFGTMVICKVGTDWVLTDGDCFELDFTTKASAVAYYNSQC